MESQLTYRIHQGFFKKILGIDRRYREGRGELELKEVLDRILEGNASRWLHIIRGEVVQYLGI